MRRFFSRLLAFLTPTRSERELARELDAHRREMEDQLRRRGLSPEDVRGRVTRAFLGVEQAKELQRDARSFAWLESARRDVRHAIRGLVRNPTFAMVAILTFALGMGASITIFTLWYSVLLRPLPYEAPERLVSLGHSRNGGDEVGLSDGAFFVYSQENRTLAALSIYAERGVNLVAGSWVERVPALLVDYTYFNTLGVRPAVGRDFAPDDDRPGARAVVIISERLWRRAYGRDASAIGAALNINGVDREIVGVMPDGFHSPQLSVGSPLRMTGAVDVWMPLALDPARARAIAFSFLGLGRLKDGVTAQQAAADLERLFTTPAERYTGEITPAGLASMGLRPSVVPLLSSVVGKTSDVLWAIMSAVVLLLGVACVNVAMLVVVRAEWRAGEIAMRRALGASHAQLVHQFVIEGVVLSLVGGALGLWLSAFGVKLLLLVAPPQLPRLYDVAISPLVVAFAFTLSLIVGAVFGFVPVLLQRPSTGVRIGGARSTDGPGARRARSGLVVTEIAMAFVLVVGAGLMLRTSRNLLNVDPGFRMDHLLLFNLTVSGPEARTPIVFHQRVLDRLQAVPGVRSATAGPFGVPVESAGPGNPVWLEEFPVPQDSIPGFHPFRIVMPGYFDTFGIPILRGRAIDREDIERNTGAVVVSQQFADRFWPGGDAIGKRVKPVPTFPWYTIVGIAGNTRDAGPHAPPDTMIYWPARGPNQNTYTNPQGMSYAVHTIGAPADLVASVRAALREVAPTLALASVRTMEDQRNSSMVRVSFTMALLLAGAAVAVTLAVVGIYGAVTYSVSRRTHEIGVRMALGATRRAIERLVFHQSIMVIVIGIAIGLVAASAATRTLRALLFGVSPIDGPTLVAVALLFLAVGSFACYLPSRRATRVDPLTALRMD